MMKPGKMINLVESIKSSQDDGDSESNHKGSGLWTQTVNNQMKRGYGMDDHQVSESSDSEVNDVNDESGDDEESCENSEEKNMQAEGGIGKYRVIKNSYPPSS